MPPRRRISKRIPHVVICVDKARSYGRGILLGVGDYVEENGPWSVFVQVDSNGSIDRGWLRRWRGDGIIGYAGNEQAGNLLKRSRISCVEVYGELSIDGLPHVGCDNVGIGRMGAQDLLNRGIRYLGFFGPRNIEWTQNRYLGIVEAAAEWGCRVAQFRSIPKRITPAAWEQMEERLSVWLKKLPKPVGVIADNDIHASYVLDACQRAGIAVPDEVAVLGAGNDVEYCRLSAPPLSSVISNARRIGYDAARLLSRLMSGRIRRPETLKPLLIPPVSVVTRQSTEVTAVQDATVSAAIMYVRNHACEGISVQDVARAVHSSRKTIYRRFEDVVGRSPHAEILRVQIDRAKALLVQTADTLDLVARASGFANASYFNVAFKREVGMTPGAFRRRHAAGQSGKQQTFH